MKLLLRFLLLFTLLLTHSFFVCLKSQEILNDENIKEAVNLWVSNPEKAQDTYGHISNWDVSAVTDMSSLFFYATEFNDDISNWDVSNVTSMHKMFAHAHKFNQDISGWDVSKVTDMEKLFRNNLNFNQDISSWNVSNVSNMTGLFLGAAVFNQDIGNWNVSNVTNMNSMFARALKFNQDISGWDISNVKVMVTFFQDADAFSSENYDRFLETISSLSLQKGIFLSGGPAYCESKYRQQLIDQFNWEIFDQGKSEDCNYSLEIPNLTESKLEIAPNPAQNYLNISIDAYVHYTWFDALDKKIERGYLEKGKQQLDISSFSVGTYVLQLVFDHKIISKTIVKQ
jgi:surface protein